MDAGCVAAQAYLRFCRVRHSIVSCDNPEMSPDGAYIVTYDVIYVRLAFFLVCVRHLVVRLILLSRLCMAFNVRIFSLVSIDYFYCYCCCEDIKR